jgi:hypothetical protein
VQFRLVGQQHVQVTVDPVASVLGGVFLPHRAADREDEVLGDALMAGLRRLGLDHVAVYDLDHFAGVFRERLVHVERYLRRVGDRLEFAPVERLLGHGFESTQATLSRSCATLTGSRGTRLPGWDPITGWGTPDAQILIPLLARHHQDARLPWGVSPDR